FRLQPCGGHRTASGPDFNLIALRGRRSRETRPSLRPGQEFAARACRSLQRYRSAGAAPAVVTRGRAPIGFVEAPTRWNWWLAQPVARALSFGLTVRRSPNPATGESDFASTGSDGAPQAEARRARSRVASTTLPNADPPGSKNGAAVMSFPTRTDTKPISEMSAPTTSAASSSSAAIGTATRSI